MTAPGRGLSPAGNPASPSHSIASAEERLGTYASQVDSRLSGWEKIGASGRIWHKDPMFWPAADPTNVKTRLGWLTLPNDSLALLPDAQRLADDIRSDGFRYVVLLGMGGSSLAPETLARTFGPRPGWPELRVLDSTHPATVRRTVGTDDLAKSVFVVSSKSGTTLEPNALFQYFWAEVSRVCDPAGPQFVAITDPGTPLEQLARRHGFRRCFLAPSDVGGRYSALTPFGLVPAALVGIDVAKLLATAREMASQCGPDVAARSHPGLRLGAALGELARAGRDKVVLVSSRSSEALPPWLEQLIAESLGKSGKGLVPVTDELDPLNPMGAQDRFVVEFRHETSTESAPGATPPPRDGVSPRLVIDLPDPDAIASEFFRWEFAVAAVGSILGVDPFDQPDVEIAKELAREAMNASRGPAAHSPAADAVPVRDGTRLGIRMDQWIAAARPGDYVAIQAFLDPTDAVRDGVLELSHSVRRTLRLATTTGFGPRFLHSSGQLHKGGPPNGMFLQLMDEPAFDLEVPGMSLSFGRIIRAQADGDAQALLQGGRRLVRVQLGPDAPAGLAILRERFTV